MSQLQSITGGANSITGSATDAFAGLNTQAFLDLMIAELQNQDPLNPAENEQLLNQIYQIRQIESNDALTSTLDSILLGQNVASATGLIGADVVALTDEGERVSGNVRKVTIDDGEPRLDLAVDVASERGGRTGGLSQGNYLYEVVWEGTGGAQFSVEIPANTAAMGEFLGSVTIKNLPDTEGVSKRVYRTDHTGGGDRKLVAEMGGKATTFTDTTADADRGEALTGPRQRLPFARKATVSLNNVAEVAAPN